MAEITFLGLGEQTEDTSLFFTKDTGRGVGYGLLSQWMWVSYCKWEVGVAMCTAEVRRSWVFSATAYGKVFHRFDSSSINPVERNNSIIWKFLWKLHLVTVLTVNYSMARTVQASLLFSLAWPAAMPATRHSPLCPRSSSKRVASEGTYWAKPNQKPFYQTKSQHINRLKHCLQGKYMIQKTIRNLCVLNDKSCTTQRCPTTVGGPWRSDQLWEDACTDLRSPHSKRARVVLKRFISNSWSHTHIYDSRGWQVETTVYSLSRLREVRLALRPKAYF